MDIIHIHGFKCAGSTLEQILNREYPTMLRVESSNPGKRLFYDDIPKDLLKTKAISSHLLAPNKKNKSLQVALIRDPLDRLASAWKFESEVNESFSGNFREFIKIYKNSILSNYQSKLLSIQSKGDHFASGWEIDFDLSYLFGSNFFVGTVERFDESMVLIEKRMLDRGLNIDLSYPNKKNTTSHVKKNYNKENLLRFAYSSIDLDLWLLKYTNNMIDKEISKYDDFDEKLKDFKKRCKTSKFAEKLSDVVHI